MACGLRVPEAVGRLSDATRAPGKQRHRFERQLKELLAEFPHIGQAEGISVCPEAAACVVALRRLIEQKWIKTTDEVVIFNTASGLKYLDVIRNNLVNK